VNNLRSPISELESAVLLLPLALYRPLLTVDFIVNSGYIVIACEKYFNHIWPKI